MKKNILAILILALLIVNIVLTSIMMFSVTSASGKTAALVNSIAEVIQLEVGTPDAPGEEVAEVVKQKDVEVYDIADKMTIALKKGDDEMEHFAQVSVSLSMNKKADGYKDYASTLSTKESLIKSAVNDVFNQYTMDEAQSSKDEIRGKIVEEVQKIFDSQFIFDVSFREIIMM